MEFLAMSKRVPGVADAEVTKHGEAEALAVFRLMQAGIFDQIHYSADWKGAVLSCARRVTSRSAEGVGHAADGSSRMHRFRSL
jgi:hypothetical protein